MQFIIPLVSDFAPARIAIVVWHVVCLEMVLLMVTRRWMVAIQPVDFPECLNLEKVLLLAS